MTKKMKHKTETGIRSKFSASVERATTGSRKEKQEIFCMRDIALLCSGVALFLAQDCLFTETSNVNCEAQILFFINPNTSLHSVVFLSTFRSDCAAFIRMTNGRLAETGTFKVFSKKLALVKTSHNKLKVQKK